MKANSHAAATHVLTMALAILAMSCGGNPAAPAQAAVAPPSASVTVSGLERYAGSTLAPNMSVQLAATLKHPDGSTTDCTATATWTSSDEKRLKLTGKAPGEFLLVDAGDSSASAVCAGTTGTLALHIDTPTSWPVSGRVVGGPGGDGVGGATLTFGSSSPVTSAADGRYTIVTPDLTTQRLIVSAPGYPTRETYLRGGVLRSLDIDLIAPDMLTLWRAMAHNGAESPNLISQVPTQRWTQNPNIYLWTTWKDTGAPVANVDFFVTQIRRVIPQLSGFTLQAGLIETGSAQRSAVPGWINVQFHHSGNYGYLGKNPGEVQFAGDSACNHIAITHEIGHAMGYWHTGQSNTIMGSTPGYCHDADLTPGELRVAKAMYARAPYNYEPDRETSTSSALSMHPSPGTRIDCSQIIR